MSNRLATAPVMTAPWPALRLPKPAEALLAFVAAGCFYVSLYGELPYHDVAKLSQQINGGRYLWDIAHIFMQPATLLWHRLLGFGESAEQSQKHINTFATAVAIGIFHYTLCRLNVPVLRRLLSSLLLAASSSLIILAPSGHMKLLAFPFVNAALYQLIFWEQDSREQRASPRLVGSAIFLGLAGAFLASCLATIPFAVAAVFIISLRQHRSAASAMANTMLFGAICAAVFGACVVFGYIEFAGQPLTIAGLHDSVALKAGMRPSASAPTLSIISLARLGFGTVNNFIAAPDLGGVVRAYLGGQINDLRPYMPQLLWQAIPVGATCTLLAIIYLWTARSVARGASVWAPLAFLCGAQAWTIYYGMNDPEHWFQLSAPTIILFLQTMTPTFIRWTLPLWSIGTLAVNLALYAIPQATYPLHNYERQLESLYSPDDLILYFVSYPGTHYLGFFNVPRLRTLAIDKVIMQSKDPDQAFARIRDEVLATQNAGGRVIVFDALDPYDWNGAWATFAGMGIAKARVTDFLASNFKIEYLGRVAEMPAWRIDKP
jgi:hypothetical protein